VSERDVAVVPRAVKALVHRIERDAARLQRNVAFMEVCGTHTHAIARAGIRHMLPPNVRLISGPGCGASPHRLHGPPWLRAARTRSPRRSVTCCGAVEPSSLERESAAGTTHRLLAARHAAHRSRKSGQARGVSPSASRRRCRDRGDAEEAAGAASNVRILPGAKLIGAAAACADRRRGARGRRFRCPGTSA
jgi:hypothetical protein